MVDIVLAVEAELLKMDHLQNLLNNEIGLIIIYIGKGLQMRIAVSSDDKTSISYRLCKARGFMIYDVDDGQVRNQFYRCFSTPEYRRDSRELKKLVPNSHKIIEALLDCDVVISYAIDKDLRGKLEIAGIEVIQSKETDIEDALDVFIEERFKVINE